MPFCKICKERIDVSRTGVRVFKCRVCGKNFCKDHFLPSKGVCLLCAGYTEAEVDKRPKKFSSFVRKNHPDPRQRRGNG